VLSASKEYGTYQPGEAMPEYKTSNYFSEKVRTQESREMLPAEINHRKNFGV
jgi:Ca2+-binding EF-hand superfamily protein